MAPLVYVTSDLSGYHRKGRGKGFEYFDDQGRKLSEKNELKRINELRIPPAWRNVWICKEPDGHLQATGIDARGRKQYLYHAEWTRQSLITKFDRMAGFARVLPGLRKKVRRDLNKQGWPREKVISLLISILDQSSLRIGNKAYEQENGTYGLTTLKRKHLKQNGNTILFQFKAKGGIWRSAEIRGKKLTRLIRECSELPGQEVFQYLDSESIPHPIFSQDVNAYLHEITGGHYTAKDFRTWGGTVWTLDLLPETLEEISHSPKRSITPCLVKKVAEKLGNTIAVCKAYYIHPAMLTLAEKKEIDISSLQEKAVRKYPELHDELSANELLALYLIENQTGIDISKTSS
jgi:DNA topoisomerase-1